MVYQATINAGGYSRLYSDIQSALTFMGERMCPAERYFHDDWKTEFKAICNMLFLDFEEAISEKHPEESLGLLRYLGRFLGFSITINYEYRKDVEVYKSMNITYDDTDISLRTEHLLELLSKISPKD